jgi:ATP-dependent DNA ligase
MTGRRPVANWSAAPIWICRPHNPAAAAIGYRLHIIWGVRAPPPALGRLIEPCLPNSASRPPAGEKWIHEIKQDGFRIIARRDSAGVRLLTRNGHAGTGLL